MICLVVGRGSIGIRRGRVLEKLGHTVHYADFAPELPWPDMEDALTEHQYDVILLCTPPDSGRAEQVMMAFEHGAWAVFIEKPMAMTREEIGDIQRIAASDPNIVTHVACNLRFAYADLLQERVGRFRSIELVMRQDAALWSPTHRPITLAMDSIHELDMAYAFFGEMKTISGWSTEDECEAEIYHVNGGVSVIKMDRLTDPPTRYVRTIARDGSAETHFPRMTWMYMTEMHRFMAGASHTVRSVNPVEKAAHVHLKALEIA